MRQFFVETAGGPPGLSPQAKEAAAEAFYAALCGVFGGADRVMAAYSEHVELKAPELAAPIRAQLEREFRIALRRLCGNEGAAAVHAQWDGEDWGPRGRNLDELSHEIVASLRARLPAGARFTCWPNIAYLSAPAALSR